MTNNSALDELRCAIRSGEWVRARLEASAYIRARPLDAQGWVSLAEALIGLGLGAEARLALLRGRLLDPEGIWLEPLLAGANALPERGSSGAAIEPGLLRVRPVTVCAAIIAKDGERCIARCLESLQGAVDEIIVMDAGSTDRTKEIAAGYPGVKIVTTEWKDSLSAASNETLPYITSDWALWIDADEWLHPEDREAVREAAGLFDPVSIPSVLQIWRQNLSGTGTEHDFSRGRLFPLRYGLRFFGRIHHEPATKDGVYAPAQVLRRKVGIRLLHGGDDPKVSAGKANDGLAERLLALSRAEEPANPAWPFFLGRERVAAGRYKEAETLFEEALRLAEKQPRFGRVLELRLWQAKAAFALRRWNEVQSRCRRMLEERPDVPDAHYYLAQALTLQAQERLREAERFALAAMDRAKTYRGAVPADRSIREWRAPVLLADLAVHRGRLAEARAVYEAHVRKAGPQAESIRRKLAFIERQRRKLEEPDRPSQ